MHFCGVLTCLMEWFICPRLLFLYLPLWVLGVDLLPCTLFEIFSIFPQFNMKDDRANFRLREREREPFWALIWAWKSGGPVELARVRFEYISNKLSLSQWGQMSVNRGVESGSGDVPREPMRSAGLLGPSARSMRWQRREPRHNGVPWS